MKPFVYLRQPRYLTMAGSLVVMLGLAGWWYGQSALAWYYVQRLCWANADERHLWAERAASLDQAALPHLLACLRHPDPGVCANVQSGLACLAVQRQTEPAFYLELVQRLVESFPQLSLAGQCSVLDWQTAWLQEQGARPEFGEPRRAVLRLLPLAGRSADKEVRGRALRLAGTLLTCEHEGEALALCRELLRKGLYDADAANRALAAQLAARPELNLLPQVAPLLDDPVAEVRQAAMLAVGPYPEAVATDDLLRSLHDPDDEVRVLCEAALRSRGLKTSDVHLGRLISDPRPGVRLQVLDHLRCTADLEPGAWLRRLSHDTSAAVRAAAVRAAGEDHHLDLSDRLAQMAQSDPSPTVRQLAGYYLRRQRVLPGALSRE